MTLWTIIVKKEKNLDIRSCVVPILCIKWFSRVFLSCLSLSISRTFFSIFTLKNSFGTHVALCFLFTLMCTVIHLSLLKHFKHTLYIFIYQIFFIDVVSFSKYYSIQIYYWISKNFINEYFLKLMQKFILFIENIHVWILYICQFQDHLT